MGGGGDLQGWLEKGEGKLIGKLRNPDNANITTRHLPAAFRTMSTEILAHYLGAFQKYSCGFSSSVPGVQYHRTVADFLVSKNIFADFSRIEYKLGFNEGRIFHRGPGFNCKPNSESL